MNQPRKWKQLERHHLSAAYDDIAGAQWEEILDAVREFGIVGRKITLHEGQVIDGWQLHRAGIETGTKPVYENLKLPKGMTLEQWVEMKNDHRRHESMDVMMKRAAERRERVAAARVDGKSLRTIADEEDVSEKTIREDIKTITAGGTQCDPPDGKVTGKDDRQQPATKPLCASCSRLVRVQGKPPLKGCAECKALRSKDEKPKPPVPSTPAPLPPAPQQTMRSVRVVDALHEIYESLQQAVEGTESVFKAELARQQKKLALVMADIELILEKPQPANGKFVKPTVEEVAAYCKERSNRVDPEQFVDHYTANGWKVGKNAMKDWRASVRTWEKNDHGSNRNGRISRVEAPAGKYRNVGTKVQA